MLSDFERRLTDLAIRNHYLTQSQVRECVEYRSTFAPSVSLETLLVERSYLTEAEVEELSRLAQGGAPPPAPRPAAPPDARTFGSCSVLEPLARGPSGSVCRGYHAALGQDVAVKIISDNPLNRPFIDRFLARTRRASDIHHPNVARVIEVGRRPDAAYIVSEFLAGIPLRDHVLGSIRLGLEKAIGTLKQIAAGVAAFHERGVVHGNLKPENVFLLETREVKLTDAGLARDDAGFLRRHADLAGSIVFTLAPEQWSREATPASDLYACGILWHFMLTGRYPFEGSSCEELRQKHERSFPPAPSERVPGLPPAADALFRKLTQKDPTLRCDGPRALLEALDRLENRHVASQYPTPPPVTRAMARRSS